MIGVPQSGVYTDLVATSKIPSTTAHLSGPLIDYLARLLRSGFEEAIAPDGLRPRHLIALTILREQDGSSTQQALASSLRIDRTNVVGLLNELERKGLVVRKRSDEDRRRHIVQLTRKGENELTKAEHRFAVTEEEVLGALDIDEREQLYTLLSRATRGQAIDCPPADKVEQSAAT
jgi:DNA-binding MarR family transcriptional regulator